MILPKKSVAFSRDPTISLKSSFANFNFKHFNSDPEINRTRCFGQMKLKNLTLRQIFIASKWTLRCLAGLLLIFCLTSLIYSFFHREEEKVIRSLNVVFLIGVSLSVHYLYVKMILITYGLSIIGLMLHSIINENLFALFITLIYIVSGSEFIIVATLYKEKRLKELIDQRYSTATVY